eukprot:TRINITY_DN1486_c0_g2_i2.p2 TRINITY_DN1486_c0_g2~~TRINITY_DN1486_c0_g2_i2.p2  ORF type:complete len:110 (-),score=40.54 TRINITY_DN1486_c0_g2_i2:139-468(-)
MFASFAKKALEKVDSLLNDENAINKITDIAYEPIANPKKGTVTLDEFDKAMNKAFKDAGMSKGFPRKGSEKIYEKVVSDKAKVMSKEELGKEIRGSLVAMRAHIEEKMK